MTENETMPLLENGYIEVTEVSDASGDYEWASAGVAYNPEDGQFYWTNQGGCSCNMFEWPGSDQYAPGFDGRGSRHEAIAFLNSLPTDDKYLSYAENVIDRAVQDVLAFKHVS